MNWDTTSEVMICMRYHHLAKLNAWKVWELLPFWARGIRNCQTAQLNGDLVPIHESKLDITLIEALEQYLRIDLHSLEKLNEWNAISI